MKLIELACAHCSKPVFRQPSYHKHMVEKRNTVNVFCSKACKNLASILILPEEAIISEYLAGNSLSAISEKHKVSAESIRRRLLKNNVTIRRKWEHILEHNPTKGIGHTDATKSKLRELNRLQFSTQQARDVASHNQCKVMSEGKISSVSKIEDMVALELDKLNISYTRQFAIRDPKSGKYFACVDFMLSDNVVIEVNGTYWHCDPRIYTGVPKHKSQLRSLEKYSKKVEKLKELGFSLIEIWELDIRANPACSVNNALSLSRKHRCCYLAVF